MNNKIVLSRGIAASISLIYFIFSIVLVTTIYYLAPAMGLTFVDFYKSFGASLPAPTLIILKIYGFSYILCFVMLILSVRLFLHNEKSGVNTKSFVFLNISLLICIIWFALAIFSLQIPIQQMSVMK